MAFTRPKAAQIDFDITNISDPLIRLNSGETGSADKDVGIVIERGDDTNVAIIYDESADQFVLINTAETGTTSGDVTISSYAGLQANAIVYGSLNDGTTTLTASTAELNLLDGVTGIALGSANELVIVDSDGTGFASSSTLSIDVGNNYIGINQTSPEVTLHMTGEDTQTAQIRMEQYNNSTDAPDIRTRRYRGTVASPLAVNSGDYLFRSNHEYYNGTSLIVGGSFAFDNTNNAARTQFSVAVDTDGTGADPAGNNGQFKIDGNDSGAITFNNAYKFPTTDGDANQVLTTDGSGSLTFADIPSGDIVEDTTPQLGGNLDLNSNNITGTGNINNTGTLTVSGAVNFDDTTASTSTTTGALIVDGGVGIAENLYVGGTIDMDRLSLTSSQTTVPPLRLTANSLQDGVGALRIDGSQADIYLNPSTATHTTITFAVNEDQRLAFGMDSSSDFYITRRTGGAWYDDTFVIDRATGLLSLGYGATVAGTLTYSTLNDGTTALTSTVAELNVLDGIPGTLTATELGYVDGVTSAIQTQLDAKAPLAAPAFTGTATGVNLTLSGDLTVNGTTTTVNTTNLVVSDNLIELNNGAASNANDSGIVIERGSTGDNAIIAWDESADKFIVGTTTATGASTGDLTITTGTLVANIEGNVTGDVTGNADTATALATARNIAGNSFDGTGDITIASTDLSDTSNLVRNNQNNTITSTTAGSSAAPEFELFRDITGTDANYIGQIKFSADNDADQKTVFAKITGKIGDASDGSEDGIIEIAHQKAGSQNIGIRITSTEFKIMNSMDFDVETHDGSSTGLRLANTLVTATAAELNYVDGVTSNIQTQLDAKAPTADPTFTGTLTYATLNDGTTALTSTVAEINKLDGMSGTAVGTTDTQTLTNKTLTAPVISTISNVGTLTLPTSTGTVALTSDIPTVVSSLTNDSGYITSYTVTESDVTTHQAALSITESQISDLGTYLTASDITGKLNLSGGTMSGAIAMGTSKITGMGDPTAAQDAATKAYVDSQVSSVPTGDITAVNITAGTGLSGTVSTASGDHTQTLSIDSTVATLTGSQTLTNKTLTTPVISSISNTGTLTLPTSTGTVALTSDIPTAVSSLTNDSGYITGYTVTESDVTTHQAALSVTESQISDLGSYITASSSDTLTNKTLGATTVAGHIIPDTDEAYDLGSSSLKFRDLYLSGSSLNLDAFSIETHASGITFNHSSNTTLLPVGGGSHTLVTLTETQTLTNKTLTSPTINGGTATGSIASTGNIDADNFNTDGLKIVDNNIQSTRSNDDILLIPNGTGSVVINGSRFPTGLGTDGYVLTTDGAGTLTWAESGSGGITAGHTIQNAGSNLTARAGLNFDGTYIIATDDSGNSQTDITLSSQLQALHNTTMPTGAVVGTSDTQTLSNKTIDSATNTLTLDLSEGTLTGTTAEFNTALSDDSFATLTNTVTLTNKTLTSPTITSPSMSSATVTTALTLNAQADLRFADSDSSNWVAFQAPATVSSNVTWTLPSEDGSNTQVLTTDGSGNLSWSDGGGGGGGASTLSGLGDVTISSVATNDLVVYTGSGWENKAKHEVVPTVNFTKGDGTAVLIELTNAYDTTTIIGYMNDRVAPKYRMAFTDSSGTAHTTLSVGLDSVPELTNIRNIGGVAFDGSVDIDLPGVNTAGNQDTSGTAAIATQITATANNTTNETVYLTFVDGATGTQGLETDTGLAYNPSTGNLGATIFTGTATAAQYADLAEMYATDEEISAGTVVMFAGAGKVKPCHEENCKRVAGIVSTDPAYLMNSACEGVPLAISGRVPCRVIGPVEAGDLMVSAGNGLAMANNDATSGTIIGKAIEENADGEGIIEILAMMM